MARTTTLDTVSVYMDSRTRKLLLKAAAKDSRSLSNFMLLSAIERAEQFGVAIMGAADVKESKVASGGIRSRK